MNFVRRRSCAAFFFSHCFTMSESFSLNLKHCGARVCDLQRQSDCGDVTTAPSGGVGWGRGADIDRPRDRGRRRRPRRPPSRCRRPTARLDGGDSGGPSCSTSTTFTDFTTTSMRATTAPSTPAPGRSATSPVREFETRSPVERWICWTCCRRTSPDHSEDPLCPCSSHSKTQVETGERTRRFVQQRCNDNGE